jgi:hypothetical protein
MGANSKSKDRKLDPELAVKTVAEAVKVRDEISGYYRRYHGLAKIAMVFLNVKPHNFKKAVDAIYYLGGAGEYADRLAATLDSVAKMYMILDFIGEGKVVEEYLKDTYGIKISIPAKERIKEVKIGDRERVTINNLMKPKSHGIDMDEMKTNRDLVKFCFDGCLGLQSTICSTADYIKDHLKPKIENALLIQPPEYARFFNIAKAKLGKKTEERQARKKKGFETSHEGMNLGFAQLKATPIKDLIAASKANE